MDRIILITEIIDGVVQIDKRYLRLSTVQDIRFTRVDAQPTTSDGPSKMMAGALLTQQGIIYAKYPFQTAIAWATLFDTACGAEFETLRQNWLLKTIRLLFTTGLSQDPTLLEQDGRYEGCYNGFTTHAEYRRQPSTHQQLMTYHISMDSSHIRRIFEQSGIALSREILFQVLAQTKIQQPEPTESGDVCISVNVSRKLGGQMQWFLDEEPSS